MLVAMAVLLLMMGIIFKITQSTADTWRRSTGKIEGFREARGAFDAMTRAVSQATLNTYFDYVNSSGDYINSANSSAFTPDHYARRSDLHFVSGKQLLSGTSVPNPTTHSLFFQAPLGYTNSTTYQDMDALLNACGFYVCYGTDITKPSFLTTVSSRYRYRLIQFTQPAQNLSIYDSSITGNDPSWNNTNWFISPLQQDLSASTPSTFFQLAENIVALVVLPKYSSVDQTTGGNGTLSSDYEYDSRNRSSSATLHQLPPVIQIVLVAIDEASAVKLGNSATPPNLGISSLFQLSSKLADDLTTLGNNLAAVPGNSAGNKIPLRYEIFQADIAIRGAKWSK